MIMNTNSKKRQNFQVILLAWIFILLIVMGYDKTEIIIINLAIFEVVGLLRPKEVDGSKSKKYFKSVSNYPTLFLCIFGHFLLKMG